MPGQVETETVYSKGETCKEICLKGVFFTNYIRTQTHTPNELTVSQHLPRALPEHTGPAFDLPNGVIWLQWKTNLQHTSLGLNQLAFRPILWCERLCFNCAGPEPRRGVKHQAFDSSRHQTNWASTGPLRSPQFSQAIPLTSY